MFNFLDGWLGRGSESRLDKVTLEDIYKYIEEHKEEIRGAFKMMPKNKRDEIISTLQMIKHGTAANIVSVDGFLDIYSFMGSSFCNNDLRCFGIGIEYVRKIKFRSLVVGLRAERSVWGNGFSRYDFKDALRPFKRSSFVTNVYVLLGSHKSNVRFINMFGLTINLPNHVINGKMCNLCDSWFFVAGFRGDIILKMFNLNVRALVNLNHANISNTKLSFNCGVGANFNF